MDVHRVVRHQPVAGPLEGGTENGADPAGSDDTDIEAGGSLSACGRVSHSRNASAFRQHVAFGL